MPKGYLAFILHAHLPFVHHPEYESFLEERWFFEAMTETYIPFVKMGDQLLNDNVPCRITLSISPSLLAMMESPLLQDRYHHHLNKLIELAEKEIQRNEWNGHFKYLAEYYRDLFKETQYIFTEQYQKRISSAFKKFHEAGIFEIMTSSATHGLLPALSCHPKAVDAQVITGLDYFENVFGFRSQGIWLPECGYFPGVENVLAQEGVRFFVVESHGIEHANNTPFYGVYSPMFTEAGVAAFGREQNITKQVWSSKEGFPGHPDYREFYRDIGYDSDFHYIQPYIQGDIRVDTGIKYFRITGPTQGKDGYHPDWARERAAQHAGEFLFHRTSHVEYLAGKMETSPVVCAPFDAELFGHWWFEGPQWLEFVIRKTAFDQNVIELINPSEYLNRHPVHQKGTPVTSTWGHKGYFEYWINGDTDWIYPQLFECALRMEDVAQHQSRSRISAIKKRALNQSVRELLLAQSSDWPFIITNGTSAQYASRRVRDHVARFNYLINAVVNDEIDEEKLTAIETMDDIFSNVNWKVFCK